MSGPGGRPPGKRFACVGGDPASALRLEKPVGTRDAPMQSWRSARLLRDPVAVLRIKARVPNRPALLLSRDENLLKLRPFFEIRLWLSRCILPDCRKESGEIKKENGNMGRANGTARQKEATARAVRDRVVLDNLSLVKAIAIRVHESLPVHVDLDDLVHAGVLGLFDAASKYNPDKKVVFQSYAKHRVKGAILDSLRQLDWASRDLRKRQKQLDAVTHNLMTRLGRTPTEAEIAETLGLGIERWRRVALELKNLGLISTSSLRPDPDNSAPIEFPAAPDSQPDRICAQRQLSSVLAGAMKCLPERSSIAAER